MNALHASENKSTFTWVRLEVALIHAGLGNGQRVFVRVGDFVDFRTEKNRERYCTTLGTGPYQITELGSWKCGGLSLSVRTKKHKKYPINAEVVQYVHTMTRLLTYKEMVLYFEHRPEFENFRNNTDAIRKTIKEFDLLIQDGTYYNAHTGSSDSRVYDEGMLSKMFRTRNFLAQYIGMEERPLPSVL